MLAQPKSLSLAKAALLFAVPAAVFSGSLFVGIPVMTRLGWHPFLIFVTAFVGPLVGLFIASLVAYHREGNPCTWEMFRDRMRLGRPRGTGTWLWILALTVLWEPFGIAVAYPAALILAVLAIWSDAVRGRHAAVMMAAVVSFTMAAAFAQQLFSPLGSIVFYTVPATFLTFMAHIQPDSFFGIELSGQWWLVVFYLFVVMFFNIFGEELWWRGIILPRQELAHGQWAWVFHGLLWAGFHVFSSPDLQSMLERAPTYLALAFVCQRTESTWPAIIAHFVGNSPILLLIVDGAVS